MIAILRTIAIRLVLCGIVTWMAFRYAGLTTAVPTVILYAIALPKPLLDLASELRHQYRRHHWRDREGRHYVYHGMPLSVQEDIEHRRWIGLVGVRAIVGFTASDSALSRTYPDGWRLFGRPPEPHLRDDALIAHLRKERSANALKFRHWIEREIAFPARRQRERYGIRGTSPSRHADAEAEPGAGTLPDAVNPAAARESGPPAPSSNSR